MSKEYDFLKKQRYEYYKGTTEIMDNEVNDLIEDVVDVLNQKDCSINELIKIHQHQSQRIAELEEQLKNAILLPKYEKGQKIYYIVGKNIKEAYFQSFAEAVVSAEVILNPQEITDEDGFTDVDFDIDMIYYKNTFATKEEAQAKLKELKGE